MAFEIAIPYPFIEPVTMPISRALELVRSDEITGARTICTLLHTAGLVPGR